MARFTCTIFFLSSPKGGLRWLRSQQDVSICLLIMARDEEALLRRHLPSWLPLLENIDLNSKYSKYAGPGGFNNPCMLISRYSNGQLLLTERQIRAQFSMWAMMASPLIISGSILKMSAETLATYSNPAVVAIDQVSYLISHQIVTTQVSIWIAN